jgi:hypothetical protein
MSILKRFTRFLKTLFGGRPDFSQEILQAWETYFIDWITHKITSEQIQEINTRILASHPEVTDAMMEYHTVV